MTSNIAAKMLNGSNDSTQPWRRTCSTSYHSEYSQSSSHTMRSHSIVELADNGHHGSWYVVAGEYVLQKSTVDVVGHTTNNMLVVEDGGWNPPCATQRSLRRLHTTFRSTLPHVRRGRCRRSCRSLCDNFLVVHLDGSILRLLWRLLIPQHGNYDALGLLQDTRVAIQAECEHLGREVVRHVRLPASHTTYRILCLPSLSVCPSDNAASLCLSCLTTVESNVADSILVKV